MTAAPQTPAPDAGAGPDVRRLAVAGLGRAGIAHAMAIVQHDGCSFAGAFEPRAELRRRMSREETAAAPEHSLRAPVRHELSED